MPVAVVLNFDHRQPVALVPEHPDDDRPVPVQQRIRDELGNDDPRVVVVRDTPLGEPSGKEPPRLTRCLLCTLQNAFALSRT